MMVYDQHSFAVSEKGLPPFDDYVVYKESDDNMETKWTYTGL